MLKILTLFLAFSTLPQYVYRAGTIEHVRMIDSDTSITLLDPLAQSETETLYCGDQRERLKKVSVPLVVLISPARRKLIHCWELGAVLEVTDVQ